MSWLKNARSLRGITSRELAEMVGKSQIYIQKIEGGEKPLPKELEESIYRALGFTPELVHFNTNALLAEFEQSGISDEETVYLGYVLVDRRIYFNSLLKASNETLEGNFLPVDGFFAKLLLESQLSVWG